VEYLCSIPGAARWTGFAGRQRESATVYQHKHKQFISHDAAERSIDERDEWLPIHVSYEHEHRRIQREHRRVSIGATAGIFAWGSTSGIARWRYWYVGNRFWV
jgi:hypothetical protein